MVRHQFAVAVGTAVVATTLACPANTRADVVNIPAVRDNTLILTADGSMSAGGSPFFFAGRTNQGPASDKRRATIRFDLAAAIPPGSTITSVSLTLHMSRSVQAPTTPVAVHRLLADWGEGTSGASTGQGGPGEGATVNDATWLHRFWPSTLWTTPGGDFVAAPSASISVANINFYTWTSAQLATDVQGWVNDSATNFGWIVVGDESTSPTSKRFDSRTNGSTANRPKLTVNFTPSSVMGACCFTNGSCQLAGAATCTSLGGNYSGNGSICTPNPCPQPPGACCLPTGTCTFVVESSCISQSGTWKGPGVPCSPNPCPLFLTAFVDPLPLIGVMPPSTGVAGGAATYDIPIREFTHQIHRDLAPTRVWGYGGTFPGRTIETASGVPITIRWINDIRDERGSLRTQHFLPVDECLKGPDTLGPSARTVAHLHGGHVPANVNGYPENTIVPGEEVAHEYPNNQPAATLWYHDNALGIARLNQYLGLAGMYIVRDAGEQALNLPSGEYEIPLIIQDRELDFDGSLIYTDEWKDRYHGSFVVVNGKVWPYLNVKRGKYRFRMLNASTSRVYQFTLSNAESFQQIGTDLGLLPTPIPVNVLTLTPGERADVVVNFAAFPSGAQVFINNSAPAPFPGDASNPNQGVVSKVIKFFVGGLPGHTAALPATLRPVPPLNQSLAAHTRDIVLQMTTDDCTTTELLINQLHWDDVTERPRIGTQEIWRFINRSPSVQPMHVHLVKFQVLDRQAFTILNGQPVPTGQVFLHDSNESGWKDTVRALPGEITRVIARFDDYTGFFPYHSNIVEMQDHEMNRRMDVRPACPADIAPAGNYNAVVNLEDLLAVIAAWGNCPSGCRADIAPQPNGNDVVNLEDLLAVIGAWGACP